MRPQEFPQLVDQLEQMHKHFGRRGDLSDDTLRQYFATLKDYPIEIILQACDRISRDPTRRRLFPAPADLEQLCERFTPTDVIPATVIPEIIPANELEDALQTMWHIFHPFAPFTNSVLREYTDIVGHLPRGVVWRAIKDWIKNPVGNRAGRPHEIRLAAETLQSGIMRAEAKRPQDPLPMPAGDIDAIYAQLARLNPDNDLLKARIAAREHARATGHSLNGAEEVAELFHPKPIPRASP